MWDEISYPVPNGCTYEVWEWIRNFIPQFTEHVITYPVGIKFKPWQQNWAPDE